jgi:peptidoglycan-associated lipoprotein
MSGLKFLSVFAALVLVVGCESTSSQSGSGTSYGSSSATTGSTTGTAVATAQAGSQEDLSVNVGDRVQFGYDAFDLSADARSVLERQAAWLKSNSGVNVVVEGHCDERGTREYNLALGARRASSVKNYLVALGVADSRISTISYGKERPIAFGSIASDWAINRRGVTVVK